jgi:hypothetical protein
MNARLHTGPHGGVRETYLRLAVPPSWGIRPVDRDFASRAFARFAFFRNRMLIRLIPQCNRNYQTQLNFPYLLVKTYSYVINIENLLIDDAIILKIFKIENLS